MLGFASLLSVREFCTLIVWKMSVMSGQNIILFIDRHT